MKPLITLSSTSPEKVYDGLRKALMENGPAVFPLPPEKTSSVSMVDDDVVAVIETSGSTAKPKTVWYSHDALISSAQMVNRALGEGTWWLALPTHYIAGLQVLNRSLLAGTIPLFAPSGSVVEALTRDQTRLSAAATSGPLFTSLVPTQLLQLAEAAESDSGVAVTLRLFDRVVVGGQRVDPALVERAKKLGVSVVRTYGAAETSGGCVWDGVPLDGVTLSTMEGRVAIAGPMLAGGYVGDPEKSEATFREIDGTRWFISDDRGEILDGKLVIHGRVDEVMVSGGLKVDLAEVERFLSGIGLSGDVALVSRPDARWGEVPVVVTTAQLNREETTSMLAQHFGKGMSKVEFYRVSDMPRTNSGKVSKRALREMVAPGTKYPGAL